MRIITRLKQFCWCCGWFKNEWLGFHASLIERKGKCFYCRMDELDAKYGPGQQAETYRQMRKNKQFWQPMYASRWYFSKRRHGL